MKKKWIYRGLQVLFVLSIAGPLFGKVTRNEQFIASFTGLGYPVYLTWILMVAYLAGLPAIFQSKFPLIKEWAYAGFTFALSGSVLSHVFAGEGPKGGLALAALAFLLSSYYMEKKVKESKSKVVSSFA